MGWCQQNKETPGDRGFLLGIFKTGYALRMLRCLVNVCFFKNNFLAVAQL